MRPKYDVSDMVKVCSSYKESLKGQLEVMGQLEALRGAVCVSAA